MNKVILSAAALVMGAGMAMADPVLGVWKTQPGDEGNYAHVKMYQCDGQICGVLGQTFDASGAKTDSDATGKRMIWDMKNVGDGQYDGGKIWAPDRDKTYKSKMSLNGNKLGVSGCVAWICREQAWTRVK